MRICDIVTILRKLRWSAAAAAFAFAVDQPAYSGNWPMFRGNMARTGYISEQAAPPLTEAWTFQAGGGILSSPAVYDGVAYFGARDGRLYALNARTGAELWRYQASNWFDSSPCVSSGAVYAVSMDGYLHVLDRQTGSLIWMTALGAPSVSSPLVIDGKVYVGTGLPDKKLRVFDAFSGAPLGSFQAFQPVYSAPAAYGDNVYFGANDGQIYALSRSSLLPPDGWTHYPTAGSFMTNAVAVAGGILYALPGHDEKQVFGLDVVTGNQVYASVPLELAESWHTFTSPAVAGGRLYFAGAAGETGTLSAGNNYLSAVDTGTLASVWGSSPSLGGISNMGLLSSPALSRELLFLGTVDGRLVAVSSAGTTAASMNLSSAAYSSPAVSNGFVFVGDMSGKFFAFSAGRAAAISYPSEDAVINGTVAVSGYAANPSMTGYELEYSTGGYPAIWHGIVSSSTASAIEGGVLGYFDTAALANGNYTLRLRVLEGGAPAYENAALTVVRVNSVPQAPSGLSAADVPGDSGNRIALNWTPSPSAGVIGYRIYRDAGAGFSLLASTGASPAVYTDSAAVTGRVHTYAVRAYDGYLESTDSNQATAVSVNDTGDNAAPAAITDLEAGPGAAFGSVALSWTAPGDDGNIGSVDHFIIKYTTNAGLDWSGFDGLAGGVRPVEGPAGDNISYDVTGLLGGVTYYLAVKSVDEVPNTSQLSNIATACATVDTVPPLPPSGLFVSDVPGDDGGSLMLTWTLSPDDTAGGVYGYRIYRRLFNTVHVSSVPYAEVAAGVWSYKDTAATLNVRYYYSAAAFDGNNNSVLSAETSGVSADNYKFVSALTGGSLFLADGARVDIPGGSLSQNGSVIFVKLDPATFQPLFKARANTRVRSTGIVYRIGSRNSATKLVKPAVVTLPYTDAAVAGMNVENLRLYTLVDGVWTLVNTSKPDPAQKVVSAEVEQFSTYSIMEYLPSGELLDKSEVYTYPNPARTDSLTFKFRTAYKSDVRIDVYNIAGEKVAAFEKADCPAGLTSEIVWNIRNIASGVYQYRVEAASASGTKSIMKRLAIIH